MALCRLYTPMEHGSSEDWQPSGSAVPLLWVGSGMWLAKLGYTGFLLERVLLDDIRRHPAAMTKLFLYFENAANKYFLNINKCFVFRNEQTIRHCSPRTRHQATTQASCPPPSWPLLLPWVWSELWRSDCRVMVCERSLSFFTLLFWKVEHFTVDSTMLNPYEASNYF